MKHLMSIMILFSASAGAIEATDQILIDDFIREHKTSAPTSQEDPTHQMEELRTLVDVMSSQASSITSQLNSATKKLVETETTFNSLSEHNNLYENERFTKSLVTRLEAECCKFVNDPPFFYERMERIDKRWKEEYEKRNGVKKTSP